MSEWKETDLGRIPFEWEIGYFKNDLRIQGRIGWKGYKTSDLVVSGPYVIGGAEIKSKIFLDLTNAQCLSREKYEESPEIMLQDGDVLLVTRGNLGEVGYYHSLYGEGTINPSVIILNQFEGDSKFLFYYLKSRNGNANVMSLASGSSVPAIYQADVKELKYPKPSIAEQQEISEVVFSIDLKIDLLHRQNKTLEQLAETLFRQRFVEEAEESWEVAKLDDVISVKGGRTPSTSNPDFWNGNISWTSPRDLSNASSIFMFDTERKITEKGLAQIGSGLLPVGTVLLSSRAPIGYLTITELPVAINQGYIAIVCDKIVSNYYIFLWCKANMDTIESAGNGSVFQEISKASFKSLDFVIPPKERMIHFDKALGPIFQKLKSNNIQIRTLTQLRDKLLPKLMSGEVRVKNLSN